MTAVEFLAERYNYITWMRNRDEISAGTADELRAKFLKEAKEMEKKQLIAFGYTQIQYVDAEIGDCVYKKVPEEIYNEKYGQS